MEDWQADDGEVRGWASSMKSFQTERVLRSGHLIALDSAGQSGRSFVAPGVANIHENPNMSRATLGTYLKRHFIFCVMSVTMRYRTNRNG